MSEKQQGQGGFSVMVRPFVDADLEAMREIWNEVVVEAQAFPQEEILADIAAAKQFFAAQSVSAVALCKNTETKQPAIAGLFILHPNNIGRCGHIANASYAVKSAFRGRGIGEALVRASLDAARQCKFRILQFNAVVASNSVALKLYRKLGFTPLGAIPGGFRNGSGVYESIIPHYIELTGEDAGASSSYSWRKES